MESGILLLPQALASTMTMPISGKLMDKIGVRPLVITGLLLMAHATWRLSFLNLDTSSSEITFMLIERGFAMGLTMMPVMTVQMAVIPPQLIARSSSLTNVLRQVFASFGTAIFATLLQSRETFHQAILTQMITPDRLAVQTTVAGIQNALVQHGMNAVQAQAMTVAALYQRVIMGASVMSFEDCFYIAAIVCVVAVLPTLFLKANTKLAPQRAGGGRPAMME